MTGFPSDSAPLSRLWVWETKQGQQAASYYRTGVDDWLLTLASLEDLSAEHLLLLFLFARRQQHLGPQPQAALQTLGKGATELPSRKGTGGL